MLSSTRSQLLAFVCTLLLSSATAYDPSGEETGCYGNHGAETDVNKCQTQDGPTCTINLTCTITPESDETTGVVNVYNNACECINGWEEYGGASSGDSSYFPYTIQTSNLPPPGLYYDVVVNYATCAENQGIQWSYNGSNYDSYPDCDCEDVGSGLDYARSCRCTFPC